MALLEAQVRTANVRAKQTTTLLRLSRKDIMSMAEEEPELKARLEMMSQSRKQE